MLNKDKEDTVRENLNHSKLDSSCILDIAKRMVRVQFPGEVKRIDRAIKILGGIDCIESSVAEHGRKLQLHLHSDNKYNKMSVATKDFKPGILIKVNLNPMHNYVVEGVCVINFHFDRLCDFQYLPLVAPGTESKFSRASCLYRSILPSNLPASSWLESDEMKNMAQFLLPVHFSRFNNSRIKLRNTEMDENEPKPKHMNPESKFFSKQRKVCSIFGKSRQQISIFVSFKDPDVPTKPLDGALKLLKQRNLEEKITRVNQLFEQRPIWTKSAIRYNTGLTDEHSKIILAAVAYYFINGPWRISWVKFGYDPRKDPTARIYQTLDYRIRTAESTKLKVNAKRSYAGKSSLFLCQGSVKKISLKEDVSTKPKVELDERHYVLRPMSIPPARQMFYQLCDLLLPEIQDMISKLTRTSKNFCHAKNGWLPDNFIETCRKVVNDHVLEAVKKELLEENKILQERALRYSDTKKESGSSLNYCHKMLSNVKRGIYKNVTVEQNWTPKADFNQLVDEAESISLSSDEDNDYAFKEIIESSFPDNVVEEEEAHSDVSSSSSDGAQIDTEAVQEIKDIISMM